MRYITLTHTHKKSGLLTLALLFSIACQNRPISDRKAVTFYEPETKLSENLSHDVSKVLESPSSDTPEILQAYSIEDFTNDSNSITLALMNLKNNEGIHFTEGAYRIIVDEETGERKTIEDLQVDEENLKNHIRNKIADNNTSLKEIRHGIQNNADRVALLISEFKKKYTSFPYILETAEGKKKSITSSSSLPIAIKTILIEQTNYIRRITEAKKVLNLLELPQDESGQSPSTEGSTANML